ncbi:MAG: Mlc titration factor MtfA (ptsG expression regulator) [Flavobacteriales bacterium]|jgi:Mlc titration factor MtfA (ptsG expression regulator)
MNYFFLLTGIIIIVLVVKYRVQQKSDRWKTPNEPFPLDWKVLLREEVSFYNALEPESKSHFEFKMQEFLLNCRITGIKTDVSIKDQILIAASAIIPIFSFKDWRYINLNEVLLYPRMFNDSFDLDGKGRNIMGMVGSGYMNGLMILSKEALYLGFKNETDKKNTAVHEFVHLIDKIDGVVDGVPEILLQKQYVIPWLDLMKIKMEEIYTQSSDINPYGGTNQAEFFAVISEYFFERPKLLQRNHPELYRMLEQMFQQNMSSKKLNRSSTSIGRNSTCPCASGDKFKRCCGKPHYT